MHNCEFWSLTAGSTIEVAFPLSFCLFVFRSSTPGASLFFRFFFCLSVFLSFCLYPRLHFPFRFPNFFLSFCLFVFQSRPSCLGPAKPPTSLGLPSCSAPSYCLLGIVNTPGLSRGLGIPPSSCPRAFLDPHFLSVFLSFCLYCALVP